MRSYVTTLRASLRDVSQGRALGAESPLPAGMRVLGAFSFGRDALWWLAASGLQDVREVWLPEYCCPQVIRAFRRARWTLHSYRLTKELTVDWDLLPWTSSDEMRGLFLFMDFLGFTQQVSPEQADHLGHWCRYVIRDCAQGLPQESLQIVSGADGGFALFSLRKPLPIPDLALLCEAGLNRATCEKPPREHCLNGTVGASTARVLYALLETQLLRRSWLRSLPGVGLVRQLLKASVRYGQRPTSVSWPRMYEFAFDEVAASRRRNATRLLGVLNGIALYDRVPLSSAPYYFPILVDQPELARKRMREQGIETTSLWASSGYWVPRVSEGVRATVQRLLCLPVHQGLGEQEIERMCSAAKRVLA